VLDGCWVGGWVDEQTSLQFAVAETAAVCLLRLQLTTTTSTSLSRDAGVTAWLWGSDVHTFGEVAKRVLYMQQSGLMAWDDEED
jgi:hypothetical protein